MDMLVLGSKLQFTILYKNLTILGTGVYGTERKCTSLFSCSILHSVNFFRFFYTIKDLKHVHCALQLVPMKIFRTPPVRFLHRVPSVRIMWRQRIFSFRVTAISKKENLFFFFFEWSPTEVPYIFLPWNFFKTPRCPRSASQPRNLCMWSTALSLFLLKVEILPY